MLYVEQLIEYSDRAMLNDYAQGVKAEILYTESPPLRGVTYAHLPLQLTRLKALAKPQLQHCSRLTRNHQAGMLHNPTSICLLNTHSALRTLYSQIQTRQDYSLPYFQNPKTMQVQQHRHGAEAPANSPGRGMGHVRACGRDPSTTSAAYSITRRLCADDLYRNEEQASTVK